MFQNSKILVTGSLGFIGSNLVNDLVSNGALVTHTGRNLQKYKHRLKPKILEKSKYIEWDLTHKFPETINLSQFEYIFHLAGQTVHSYAMKNPMEDVKINIGSTLDLLSRCVKDGFSGRFIFVSSKGVTGKPESLPVDESNENVPVDIYSANKMVCEHYFRIFHEHYNLEYSIIRLTNIHGPGQQIVSPTKGILHFFIGQALQNKTITIFGDGRQIRDYIYIDDCINALKLLALSEKAKNEMFYLGTGTGIQFGNMAQSILKLVGKGEIQYKPIPKTRKSLEIGDFIVNSKKLESLGWSQRIMFEEGLKKTIEYYQNNLEEYLQEV